MGAIRFAPRAATLARRGRRSAAACVAALLALVIAAIALDADAQTDDALPTRVGRVANVQGTLRHSPEGAGVWSAVGLNYPVAQGDSLWTASDARAEVDYGGGEFRLAGATNVHVSRLDQRQLALFVASGRLIVRVRYLEPGDAIRVDTAATQLALNRPGLYRIDVDPDAQRTNLTVREGEADMGSVSGIAGVFPGQVATIATHDATVDVRNGGGLDGFDTWSAERDRIYESPRANDYVSREMVGASDFDRYGEWQSYPEYGAVWFPTVDPEWAPYRFGYWTWLTGYGYTWVDNAAWGYAPFHYGRWVHVGGRWGWCPGRFAARPAWAPALVAWYGGSAAAAGKVVGWVPLGFREPYVPSWRCNTRCYARYNRPHAIDAARPDPRPPGYANAAVPNAITTVPAATLTTERPVARNRVPVPIDRSAAPPLASLPPLLAPAPPKPDVMHPGNGAPLPAGAYAGRVAPSAPPDPPGMSSSLPPPPRSPVIPVPPAGVSSPPPAASTVRPVPVPPAAPAPPPVRVPSPTLPLPRMPSGPVPGTSPAPPAAVVPVPVRPAQPSAPAPAPAPVPTPAVVPAPAPVAPPRPPASAN